MAYVLFSFTTTDLLRFAAPPFALLATLRLRYVGTTQEFAGDTDVVYTPL